MAKSKTLKMSGKLRLCTSLRPVTQNVTKWTSVFSMVNSYFDLKSILEEHFRHESVLLDHFLSAREDICLLKKDCDVFNSVAKAMQKGDINIAEVRLLETDEGQKTIKSQPTQTIPD